MFLSAEKLNLCSYQLKRPPSQIKTCTLGAAQQLLQRRSKFLAEMQLKGVPRWPKFGKGGNSAAWWEEVASCGGQMPHPSLSEQVQYIAGQGWDWQIKSVALNPKSSDIV